MFGQSVCFKGVVNRKAYDEPQNCQVNSVLEPERLAMNHRKVQYKTLNKSIR